MKTADFVVLGNQEAVSGRVAGLCGNLWGMGTLVQVQWVQVG